MIHRRTFAAIALAFLSTAALADDNPWQIQDNSFLIEEAYNQDPRVVQHILTLVRGSDRSYNGTFTQEWPMGGIKNQISYTLPFAHGRGDVLVNYRYQVLGDGDARVAVAPRISAILPTDHHRGLDMNVPLSFVVSDHLVTHWNAGATTVQHEKTVWSAGASFIVAARPLLHVMLENRWTSDQKWTISPGVRWAYNRPNKLQIVPGIAVPFSAGHQHAVLAYLSFEHPY